MDRRFEWVTQDGLNANMMIYLRAWRSGPTFPASLSGTITDQGLLGEASAGKTIRQRTLIRIDSPDRHVMEIFFTPLRCPARGLGPQGTRTGWHVGGTRPQVAGGWPHALLVQSWTNASLARIVKRRAQPLSGEGWNCLAR
jgi:hypothetical protein